MALEAEGFQEPPFRPLEISRRRSTACPQRCLRRSEKKEKVEVEDGKIMQTTMEKKSKRGTALWIRLRLRFLTPLMVLCFSPKAKQSFTQVKSELFSNSTATAHLLLGQDSSGRPRFGPCFLTNNVLKTGSLN
ncbi:hypothetical protein ZIOFF_012769 [Zingiber officinale]|uniref:Uncharacterized protein n=1 Tax=Zingiber officinale TaxID=94328 RepID=A0A8J5IAH6_ZINOF|nr:hypothetical protein ZIOFF_012769 [Zingiber officinale]